MSVDHWQDFLRSGALTSCPTTSVGTYDKELEFGWKKFFETISPGARVLDIGTGNGPILLIAKRVSQESGRNLELHGADRAAIDPPRFVRGSVGQFDGIIFHPRCPTESLNFESESFDVVTGQYALEYGVSRKSVHEIARVMKPYACARFVVHHELSAVVENARAAIKDANWITKDLKVYRRLQQFLHLERTRSKEADRAFARLEETGQQMLQALEATPHSHVLRVTINAVQNLLDFRRNANPTALTEEVKAKQQSLESAVSRMRDLLEHACNQDKIEFLESYARRAGLEVVARSLQHHEENLIGWVLEWRRTG